MPIIELARPQIQKKKENKNIPFCRGGPLSTPKPYKFFFVLGFFFGSRAHGEPSLPSAVNLNLTPNAREKKSCFFFAIPLPPHEKKSRFGV